MMLVKMKSPLLKKKKLKKEKKKTKKNGSVFKQMEIRQVRSIKCHHHFSFVIERN